MIKGIEFRAIISPIMSGIRVGSDMMRVSFDISKSDLQDAIPLLALTDTVLKLTVEVDNGKPRTQAHYAETCVDSDCPEHGIREPKKEKPAKEPRQPNLYSYYWEAMHAKGFDANLDLQEVLDTDYEHVHEALRGYFGVESLSASIGPTQFNQFVRDKGLSEGLITLSNNAQQAALIKQERMEKS